VPFRTGVARRPEDLAKDRFALIQTIAFYLFATLVIASGAQFGKVDIQHHDDEQEQHGDRTDINDD
jgi:hypothetical protein